MKQTTGDPFNLERFVTAQAAVFDAALAELKAGRKRGHWMWFVFPQLRGLGHSAMAQFYAISSVEEARAYLSHAVLGPRLVSCTNAVLECDANSLREIFDTPDDMKFRSSMTLFALASDGNPVFQAALDRWCSGRMDDITVLILATPPTQGSSLFL